MGVQPGERIGPYVVDRRVGAGQMGVVYAVRHPELGAAYALKLLRRELCSARDLLRFQREVQHLAAVSTHRHVVPIHTAGEDRGALYYVMDLIQGETLRELLDRGGPLDPARAAGHVRDVADALAALHRHGVVHRDVKPANILVDAALDTARLADFGLARSFLDEGNRLTHTGELVGTPHFMAPEQAMGRAVGPAADVYALGMVLFTLLAGRPAVAGKGLMDVLTRVGSGELERLPSLAPETPDALVAVIEACLSLDPARRPEARQVRDALDGFLRASLPRPRSARRGGGPLAALGAGALAAVGLATAALVATRAEAPPAGPGDGVATVHTRTPRPGPSRPPQQPAPVSPQPPDQPLLEEGWLESVSAGELPQLRQLLDRLDAAAAARLSSQERQRLVSALQRLDEAWSSPLRNDSLSFPPAVIEAGGVALERLIVIHALLRRLDPAHRLPARHDAALDPTVVLQLARWADAVSPRILAELVALCPDKLNLYMLYADANKNAFAPDAGEVDLEIFRQGMRAAREQDIDFVWSRMARYLAMYLWSVTGDPQRAGPALDELRALTREIERAGSAHGEAARAFAYLQDALLPADPRSAARFPRERLEEALEVARRAVKLAPREAGSAGRLALALATFDPTGPGLTEARAEAERLFELSRLASTPDENLVVRVVLTLCMHLERQGDDEAATALCTRALASIPQGAMLPVVGRRALLLCRLEADRDRLLEVLTQLERRLGRWAATRHPAELATMEVPALLSGLSELQGAVAEGRCTHAELAAWLVSNLKPVGGDVWLPEPR